MKYGPSLINDDFLLIKKNYLLFLETVAVEYLLWGGVILIEVFNSIKFVTMVVCY